MYLEHFICFKYLVENILFIYNIFYCLQVFGFIQNMSYLLQHSDPPSISGCFTAQMPEKVTSYRV